MACLVQSLTLFNFKRMFWLMQQARPGSQEAHTDNIRRMEAGRELCCPGSSGQPAPPWAEYRCPSVASTYRWISDVCSTS